MTDLERFFRRLVGNLAAADPARLHRPLPLADVEHDIIPYRANRRALALESSEDYAMILLRLCAGEGGLARAEPEEARVRFARELGSPNPDLDILHAFDDVALTLRSESVARALGPDGETAYAPPDDEPEVVFAVSSEPAADAPVSEDARGSEDAAPSCRHCGAGLPAHRPVNFCPHCGRSQTVPECPRCRTELEPGWKHCVNCGAAVGGE